MGVKPTGGDRERAEAATEGTEYRRGVSLADRPVVAVNLLLAGVGGEPRGRLIEVSVCSTGRLPRRK
jgi:hypothetical protein